MVAGPPLFQQLTFLAEDADDEKAGRNREESAASVLGLREGVLAIEW